MGRYPTELREPVTVLRFWSRKREDVFWAGKEIERARDSYRGRVQVGERPYLLPFPFPGFAAFVLKFHMAPGVDP